MTEYQLQECTPLSSVSFVLGSMAPYLLNYCLEPIAPLNNPSQILALLLLIVNNSATSQNAC